MTDSDSKLTALENALLDETADPVDLPFSLLQAITDNFSEDRKIGSGGFGAVYKGVLASGATIAVKKLFESFAALDKHFTSEITCLAGVKHKNIVRFLGYCSETQQVLMPYDGKRVLADTRQRLLCFEYLPRGCLADYLSDESCGLEWTTRYQIILGVCEGVHYLHQQRIIHMDLKPQNVLLDDNIVPRIADFGLSRPLSESKSHSITENKIGTMGYMAPEFLNSGEITFKTDIYSLGVMIMEILMGHKECSNVNEIVESWANKFRTSEIHTTLEQVKVCAETGIKCMKHDPGNRPSTWFIIRGILGEVEISNWPITSDVATSTKGKIGFASSLVDELKLMGDSTATSQLQPSTLEVEKEDGEVSLETKGKVTTVTVATGVMSTLSAKLAKLMGDEYIKRKEVRKQASFLKKEMSTINATLRQLEVMDELIPTVKNWRDDAREISYDIENCIDDFMRQFGGEDAEASFVGEAAELHRRLCELHRIANQMEELRTLVVEANARRESYKIYDCKPNVVDVDPRLSAFYQEATSLVGIDGPREEVGSWLMDIQKKLKVVSIVGFGGLGKTTLAKQVYDKTRGHFNSLAFISVSQKPNMRVLLNRLQLKLGISVSSNNCEFQDIIEVLRNYLVDKRYLIVLDDLWDRSAWNIISLAFPENGYGSRIILTTRVEDVATVACHNDKNCIYKMKPLNEQNSRMLFSNRVFGSKVICPPYLKAVMAEILKKCGGLPLAIITIASLLATQESSRKHWENIRKSLGAQSTTHPSLKEMNTILNLGYMHLPLHLRACFLYLGMYPEDHIIWRDNLVRQWIAEGFVSNLHGSDLEDVGRSYFNELVNRSMIQPSKTEYGEVLSCTVHDMMLDLILRKCVEDNFLSVAYNSKDMTRLLHGSKYKARRLSLSYMTIGGATYGMDIASSLSQVRSFILFKNPMPPLLWFKYLRVLIIATGEGRVDLTAIGQLFQLRYIMVRVFGKIMLPTKLNELVYLETLDIEKGKLIKSIPSDIVHLPRLSYLVLPNFTELPEGIDNMISLRTLQGFDLKKSSLKCIMGLSKLTNLRELSMKTDYFLETSKVDALVSSIGKLSNLECLCISGLHCEDENNQQLGSLSDPFKHIERLGLQFWQFCRVPKWMGSLSCLRFLQLHVDKMSTVEIHLLGELPSLVHLEVDFEVGEVLDERAKLSTGLFPVLEFLFLSSGKDITRYLWFQPGAMPNLRILRLSVVNWGGIMPIGMEHLLRLQKIEVYAAANDVKSAFEDASLVHPNRPCFSSQVVWPDSFISN